MALRNRMIWIALELRATNDMAPLDAYSVAALDRNHLGRDWLLEVEVASNVVVIDILERVVRGRGANSDCFAVVGAIHAGILSVKEIKGGWGISRYRTR